MPRNAPPLLRQQRLPLLTIADAFGVREKSVRLENFRQPRKFLPPRVVQGQKEFLAVQDGGGGLAGVVPEGECVAVEVDGPGAEQGREGDGGQVFVEQEGKLVGRGADVEFGKGKIDSRP